MIGRHHPVAVTGAEQSVGGGADVTAFAGRSTGNAMRSGVAALRVGPVCCGGTQADRGCGVAERVHAGAARKVADRNHTFLAITDEALIVLRLAGYGHSRPGPGPDQARIRPSDSSFSST